MKLLLIALSLWYVLFVNQVSADTKEQRVHVIYAGDQSGSMRHSHKPSWMYAQQYFLAEYFANFHSRCQDIHFDYIGWGTDALPPLRTVLRTNADGQVLSQLLENLVFQNLKGTVQHKGMMKALSFVTDDYDRTIIIFVSEEYLGAEHDAELWRLVPPEVELIGISLGTDSVAGYFKRHIVPPTVNGRHYHAYTTPEFEQILYRVFDEIGFDHCLAG